MPKLFTPETLKDEYHEAFNKCLPKLCLLPEVESLIRKTRQDAPDIYRRLAALAHEYDYMAMREGVLIYIEAKGIE